MGLKNVGKAKLSNSGKAVNIKIEMNDADFEKETHLFTVGIKSLKELISGEKPYINVALVVPDSEGETEKKESHLPQVKWVDKK